MEQPPDSGDKAPRYLTYLLTCWQERDEVAGTVTWLFKFETPQFGSRRPFATLEEVIDTIEKEVENQDA